MTESRNGEHRTKIHKEETYRRVASTKGGTVSVVAGRTAYREEHQRDYGPDRDEPLDGTESWHEF